MSRKSLSLSLPEKIEYFQKNSPQRNHSELIQLENDKTTNDHQMQFSDKQTHKTIPQIISRRKFVFFFSLRNKIDFR